MSFAHVSVIIRLSFLEKKKAFGCWKPKWWPGWRTMSLAAADFQAIAQALQEIKHQSPVNTVALKFLVFGWPVPLCGSPKSGPNSPPVIPWSRPTSQNILWQLSTTLPLVRLKPLSLLPQFWTDTPTSRACSSMFGKKQAQKDNELLSLSGHGETKPSALLRHILSLNIDPEILLRALFLAQLPTEVRQILTGSARTDLDELATDADRIMEAFQTSLSFPGFSGVDTAKPDTSKPLCYYHANFGRTARLMQP